MRLSVALLCGPLLASGCARRPAADSTADAHPLAGVKLSLLVIGDPAMAEAIGLLRGEWQAETGSELSIETIEDEALAARIAAGEIAADAIVYSSRRLGALAEGGIIRAIERSWLAAPELAWGDVFDLVKTRELAWGADVYAVPFTSPVMVCIYRADLLERLGRKPPESWRDYQQLAELLASAKPAGADGQPSGADAADWHGTAEPLASGWSGVTLLARAAAYARHPNHYSTLFNMQSMEPLVASPPFVRALEELVAASKIAGPPAATYDPGHAWRAVVEGRCAMALGWPAREATPADAATETSGQDAEARHASTQDMEIGFVVLPGTAEVYNATAGKWERRAGGATSVPLVAASGRVGSIAAKSPRPDAATRLLAWLASPQWSTRVATAGADAAPVRRSQIRSAQDWGGPGISAAEASAYTSVVGQCLSGREALAALRIPGASRYMAALDEAVLAAVRGASAPQSALAAAAEKWQAITDELGLERQRRAYRRSLGLEDSGQ
ncbi:MAG: extracellular solute-binding protein [Planctomycetia bacterium]|nr:extracellular solute-binding protein [Planctomycetia bacterium]